MRHSLPALLLLPLLLLATGGCSVPLDEYRAQLAALEQRAAELQDFVERNAPLLAQLDELASRSGDPAIATAASRLAASVAAARTALPEVTATLQDVRARTAQLEADAAGKVPWWSVAGGLLLALVPRLAGAAVPPLKPIAEILAEWGWRALATRRQQRADAARGPAPGPDHG